MSVESIALFVALLPLATAVIGPLAAPGAARAADATLSANVNTILDRAVMGCLLNGALHDQSYLFRRDVAIVSDVYESTLQNCFRLSPAVAMQLSKACLLATSSVGATAQPTPGVPAAGSSATAAH